MDQFRDLFAKLDKNNDGHVSVEELHNEMRRIGVTAAQEKSQTIVNNYDQNKDGRLDYEEFLGYIMDRERKWIINFHALDKNKCGVIDQGDIIDLFKDLGVVITKRNAKKIIQMMDKDSSMTVDWEEFLHHIILNPAENIKELVSSWKHSLVFDVGESRSMAIESTQQETDVSLSGNFVVAAGLADAVSRTVTAPIDRLKTLLQVKGSKAVSFGMTELQAGGLRSMWQGNMVNVLKGTPQSTLQCIIYAQMKSLSGGQRETLSVQHRFGMGCVSGASAHAVFYPLEVLKVRLNLQQASSYYGVFRCARTIYQNESAAAFYRGFKPSILCMIPYAGVECAVHQSIMSWVKRDPEYNSEAKLFIFSFVAFACGQATSYPLALSAPAHSRLQAWAYAKHSSAFMKGKGQEASTVEWGPVL